MNDLSGKHISVLDSLRAFAAISVCLFHFVCTTTGYISTKEILEFFSIGKYGVQLFFVISGFVIPWAMYIAKYQISDFFIFFIKRFSRLEPPYIASLVTMLVIIYARSIFIQPSNAQLHPSVNQVLLHFGYLIPFFSNYKWLNDVYWTLAIEFQYYLFIALVFPVITKPNLLIRIAFYTLCIATSFTTKSTFLPYWMPFFGLGIVLFLKLSNLISKHEYFVVTGLLTSFCLYKHPLPMVVFALLPVITVLFWRDMKVSGLNFLGKFSYSIYLFHPVLGATFINVMSHKYNSDLEKILVITSGFIITLLSAWLTYLIVEKPSKTWSSKIRYKSSTTKNELTK